MGVNLLIYTVLVHAELDLFHPKHDIVPHVKAQLAHLPLLHECAMLALSLPRRRTHLVAARCVLHGKVLVAFAPLGQWRRRGGRRGCEDALSLEGGEDVFQACSSVTFTLPALSLSCFLSLMSLALCLVLSRATSPRWRGCAGFRCLVWHLVHGTKEYISAFCFVRCPYAVVLVKNPRA